MTTKIVRYPEYKDSAVEWLGQIPAHWQVKKLKQAAALAVSNVGKDSVDDEAKVLLCNYTDVYYHSEITSALKFMAATAPPEQIRRFQLKKGDVLITKDSETANDIAVPAVVTEELEGVLCGYHLALLRPHKMTNGNYLRYALECPPCREYFRNAANGVTRFGLSVADIGSATVLSPPLEEQEAIVRFIRAIDQRVNRLLHTKRRLIALLNEQKQAIIHQAVTRGLDPDVRLKASGVEWLGDVPEHWEVKRAKQLFQEVDSRSATGNEVLLSLRMYLGLVPHNEVSTVLIPPKSLINFKHILPGQIVMNRMRAAIGMFGVANRSGLVSPDYAVFRALDDVRPGYFLNVFKTQAAGDVFRVESKGLGTGSSGFMRLYTDRFGRIKFAVPPQSEQVQITRHIENETAGITAAIAKAQSEIELIREYRTRLVSDVVTGQLDVRGVALPELADVAGDEAEDRDAEEEGEAGDGDAAE